MSSRSCLTPLPWRKRAVVTARRNCASRKAARIGRHGRRPSLGRLGPAVEASARWQCDPGRRALPVASWTVIGDHRIAMSFAVAVLVRSAPVRSWRQCPTTSFPGFVDHCPRGGARPRGGRAAAVIPVLAIDGPSGSGKGTVCRALPRRWAGTAGQRRRTVSSRSGGQAGLQAGDRGGVMRALAGKMDIRVWRGRAEAAKRSSSELDGEDVTRDIRAERAGQRRHPGSPHGPPSVRLFSKPSAVSCSPARPGRRDGPGHGFGRLPGPLRPQDHSSDLRVSPSRAGPPAPYSS